MGSKQKKLKRHAESLRLNKQFIRELLDDVEADPKIYEVDEESFPAITYLLDPQIKDQKAVNHAKDLLTRGVSPHSVKNTINSREDIAEMRVRISVGIDELSQVLEDCFPKEDAYDCDWKSAYGQLLYLELRLYQDY